jgi:hypothetical protein
MRRPVQAAAVVGSALVLVLAACGEAQVAHDVVDECPPDCAEEDEEHERPTLTRAQMKRYYRAQVVWRDCAMAEGLDLPEPPTWKRFVADGGTWSVGADLSDDDWDVLNADVEDGGESVIRACGVLPVPQEFLVSPEALERLYAWNQQVLACLEAEGFPVDTAAPPVEDFVESAGRSWSPAGDFHARYGYPQDEEWMRVAARCGNHEDDVWLQPDDFEIKRATLKAQYRRHLALTACLEEAGFVVPEPPPLEEFIEELGWNWAHADIWGAVYRDNDRDAVGAFVDRIDELCPDAG